MIKISANELRWNVCKIREFSVLFSIWFFSHHWNNKKYSFFLGILRFFYLNFFSEFQLLTLFRYCIHLLRITSKHSMGSIIHLDHGTRKFIPMIKLFSCSFLGQLILFCGYILKYVPFVMYLFFLIVNNNFQSYV